MKPLIPSLGVFCILLIAVAEAQTNERNKDSEEEDSIGGGSSSTTKDRGDRYKDNSLPSGANSASKIRHLQAQIDRLELRLDRMIQLWNEFVDNNRDSSFGHRDRDRDQDGIRRPPYHSGSGRQPYYPRRPDHGRRDHYPESPRQPSLYGHGHGHGRGGRGGAYALDEEDDYPPPAVSSVRRF